MKRISQFSLLKNKYYQLFVNLPQPQKITRGTSYYCTCSKYFLKAKSVIKVRNVNGYKMLAQNRKF